MSHCKECNQHQHQAFEVRYGKHLNTKQKKKKGKWPTYMIKKLKKNKGRGRGDLQRDDVRSN